jgi:uncharacterized protein YbbC (DUF1343 family)
MMRSILNIFLFFVITISMTFCQTKNVVQVGLDQISQYRDLFTGKRIGIITNHTAYNAEGQQITAVFFSLEQVYVTAIFAPEHGIHGHKPAGKNIETMTDTINHIPIYSLYGKTKKPTPEMLENIDLLVYDIQDIGTRYYTYISTMALAMEAAAEHHIPFVVLDRPNPINGIDVEGNLVEAEFSSFVGLFPIPVRHGMTCAELARMINDRGWLKNHIKVDLKWIPLLNWEREMWFDQTGLTWRPPSPNMPSLSTATVYPGTCLFEGTNISEGRGTYLPFQQIGAPWFREEDFFMLNKIVNFPGVHFGPVLFSPISIPDMAPAPKFKNQKLTGFSIAVTDRKNFRPYLTGIGLVKYLYDLNKEQFVWKEKHFDRLCGTKKIRNFIVRGARIEEIQQWIDSDLQRFRQARKEYLLY